MEWLIILPVGFFLFCGFVALVLRGSSREETKNDGWTPDHNGYASGGGPGGDYGGDCGGDFGGGDSGGGCGGGD